MKGFRDFIVNEMPIAIHKVGKWGEKDKRYGYGQPDIGIMQNQRGIEKIGEKWARVEQKINAFVCRSPNCYKVQQDGEVDVDYIQNTLKLNVVNHPTQSPDEIFVDPEAITFILANNKGGERMPLNYWVMAHRLGHAMKGRGKGNQSFNYYSRELWNDIRRIIEGAYNYRVSMSGEFAADSDSSNILRNFCQAIGTMRSARTKQLPNPYEFTYELTAQWITQGKVSFNPLPRSIKYFKKPENSIYSQERQRGYFSSLYSRDPDNFESWNEYVQDHLKPMVEIHQPRS
jgi:hypothetical protein